MDIIVSCLASLFTAIMLYYILFKNWDDFVSCWRFFFTPQIISLFRNQWHEDNWAETKLFIWLGISWAAGALVYVNW